MPGSRTSVPATFPRCGLLSACALSPLAPVRLRTQGLAGFDVYTQHERKPDLKELHPVPSGYTRACVQALVRESR